MAHTSVKRISPQEPEKMRELLEVFHLAFETDKAEISTVYLERLLAQPHFWVYIFVQDKVVIGGLTGFVLPRYYQETAEFFIYDIAVHPLHQRKGIGRHLIEKLMEDALQLGVSEVFVDASTEDHKAIRFYQTFVGREEAVVQFSFRHHT